MSRNGKVIVAMSGGVDSSVAACLLKEQGYDCIGLFMRVGGPGTEAAEGDARRLRHGCCSVADALDARAIAGRLGIPFYALNFERDFDSIIQYFVDEYARARTPNPCIVCNIRLKFGKLLRYADLLGAEFVATGHYARLLRRDDGRFCLARALNRAKDQSYVLFGIRRADLPRCLFPLGDIARKGEVRRIASGLGLRVHDKPESQEICFVPDDDYRRLVHRRRPETRRAGQIRDAGGNVLGAHEGVASYTIGQRRGLGIAAGRPVYVTRLDALSNTVTVGPRSELLSGGLLAERANWLAEPPPVGRWTPAEIRIRHRHVAARGRLRVLRQAEVEALFDEPQPAVTPGQAAVFYRGELVLGGAWIRQPLRRHPGAPAVAPGAPPAVLATIRPCAKTRRAP